MRISWSGHPDYKKKKGPRISHGALKFTQRSGYKKNIYVKKIKITKSLSWPGDIGYKKIYKWKKKYKHESTVAIYIVFFFFFKSVQELVMVLLNWIGEPDHKKKLVNIKK